MQLQIIFLWPVVPLVVGSLVGMNKEVCQKDNGAYPANTENRVDGYVIVLNINFEEIYQNDLKIEDVSLV